MKQPLSRKLKINEMYIWSNLAEKIIHSIFCCIFLLACCWLTGNPKRRLWKFAAAFAPDLLQLRPKHVPANPQAGRADKRDHCSQGLGRSRVWGGRKAIINVELKYILKKILIATYAVGRIRQSLAGMPPWCWMSRTRWKRRRARARRSGGRSVGSGWSRRRCWPSRRQSRAGYPPRVRAPAGSPRSSARPMK